MADLASLLARANKRVADKEEIEAEKEQAKKNPRAAETFAINAKVKAWQEAQEWRTVGSAVRYLVVTCECGHVFTGPGQELVYQVHVREEGIRYVAPGPDLIIPSHGQKSWFYEHAKCGICMHCAEGKGYHCGK